MGREPCTRTKQENVARLDVHENVIALEVAMAHSAGVQAVAHHRHELVEDERRAARRERPRVLGEGHMGCRAFLC